MTGEFFKTLPFISPVAGTSFAVSSPQMSAKFSEVQRDS